MIEMDMPPPKTQPGSHGVQWPVEKSPLLTGAGKPPEHRAWSRWWRRPRGVGSAWRGLRGEGGHSHVEARSAS